MIAGTAYGVVLNDRAELDRLAPQFAADPYQAPPHAPVVYIKPRACFASSGTPIPLDPDVEEIALGATVGLLLGHDASRVGAAAAMAHVAAMCIALDVSVPHASYYRPAIAQRCRDGFLPLGTFVPPRDNMADIVTFVDDRETHRWSLDRLARPMAQLIADLSAFMTLTAGDLLLVGLPGDAATARAGQRIRVESAGLPSLETCVGEAA